MSEIFIFGVGAVLFVLTTGATMSFGLFRSHELQMLDMADSDRIREIEETGLTEVYRTQRLEGEDLPTTGSGS